MKRLTPLHVALIVVLSLLALMWGVAFLPFKYLAYLNALLGLGTKP
jgi:hypothetical protein